MGTFQGGGSDDNVEGCLKDVSCCEGQHACLRINSEIGRMGIRLELCKCMQHLAHRRTLGATFPVHILRFVEVASIKVRRHLQNVLYIPPHMGQTALEVFASDNILTRDSALIYKDLGSAKPDFSGYPTSDTSAALGTVCKYLQEVQMLPWRVRQTYPEIVRRIFPTEKERLLENQCPSETAATQHGTLTAPVFPAVTAHSPEEIMDVPSEVPVIISLPALKIADVPPCIDETFTKQHVAEPTELDCTYGSFRLQYDALGAIIDWDKATGDSQDLLAHLHFIHSSAQYQDHRPQVETKRVVCLPHRAVPRQEDSNVHQGKLDKVNAFSYIKQTATVAYSWYHGVAQDVTKKFNELSLSVMQIKLGEEPKEQINNTTFVNGINCAKTMHDDSTHARLVDLPKDLELIEDVTYLKSAFAQTSNAKPEDKIVYPMDTNIQQPLANCEPSEKAHTFQHRIKDNAFMPDLQSIELMP